jgi:hypothetical protein
LIATDSAASQVTSSIKDILFAKAAERIDAFRPEVANSMFGEGETTDEYTEDQE